MKSGELVAPKFELVPTDFSFQYSDNYTEMIGVLTQDEDRNRLIIQRVAKEAKSGHYCLVLSERIAHCELLHRMLMKIVPDVKAAVLIGELSGEDRQEALNGLRNKELNVLFATKVADEGLDISHLDRLFLATPYRSAYKVKQQVGRVMRPAKGKADAIVYDFVDEHVQVLKNQVEIRKDVYDSFADLGTVETPLSFDAIEELYTQSETPPVVKKRGERSGKASKSPKGAYRAVCANCGKQTTVPFVPDGIRSIYCDECFNERKPTTMERAFHQAFSKQRALSEKKGRGTPTNK